MCRELLLKYKADKAAGRFDHAKPAAPGTVPQELQAFMKEVRDFMQEAPRQSASASASADKVPTYEEQLAEHERMRMHIERMAEQDADWSPDAGGLNALLHPILLCCFVFMSLTSSTDTALSTHLLSSVLLISFLQT